MKKVLVLGCSGSGKSTFSLKLTELTGLPLIHLDALYWKPGWVAAGEAEWDAVIKEQIHKDRYIMDGNYARTLEQRLQEADTVYYFDFPRYLCLYRVLKRRIIHRGKTRPDMGSGCKEKIDLEFILWIWNFRRRNGSQIRKSLEQARQSKQVVIFQKPEEVKRYLETIGGA